MNQERWQRVKGIFARATELGQEGRDTFLADACGDDEELHAEVRSLLASVETEDEFLVAPDVAGVECLEPERGQRLGDFELLEEIGRGGMGVVYRARQVSLEREVAVKVLATHLSRSPRHVDHFLREARAAAKLHHRSIVSIHFVGNVEDAHFFAMEFVGGRDLHEELKIQAGLASGRTILPPRDSSRYVPVVTRLCADAADALQYAHERGIVHRDVKPHNLLLRVTGDVCLADFGLAKDESLGSISKSEEIQGTPYYMSPEQTRVEGTRVGHRTDVYSLGVVLYELLTLHRPFSGTTSHEVLHAIAVDEPETVRSFNPRVPKDLETICAKAMEKSPERRYATAAAFADDLRRFLNHEAILARPATVADHLSRSLRRHRGTISIAVLILVALVTGILLAERRAKALELETDVALLSHLEAVPDLGRVDLERLRAGREALRRVARDGTQDALVARLGALFEELRARWKREGTDDVERSFGSPDALTSMPSDRHLFQGLARLHDARSVFPEDADLTRLASVAATFPLLTVDAPRGAPITLRPLDPLTGLPGQSILLGAAPLRAHPVPPGEYRVTVEGDDGFCEMTRTLTRRGRHYEVTAVIRPTQNVVRGMIRIPAGRFIDGDARADVYRRRELDLPSFWIDECEVSNGDYHAFCQATGHVPPIVWNSGYDSALADLPVTGISWQDAVAYAEWAGKRLPSNHEWGRAARGEHGYLYPWGNDPRHGEALANIEDAATNDWNQWTEAIQRYRDAVAPVKSFPAGRSPDGLYHVLGNVAELTESPYVQSVGGELAVMIDGRIMRGGGFDLQRGAFPLSTVTWVLGSYKLNHLGFRCAKSADP